MLRSIACDLSRAGRATCCSPLGSALPGLPSHAGPRLFDDAGAGGVIGARWATSKAGGSTKNGRDSQPKYLGVKRYGGEYVEAGEIIIRQRGMRYGIVKSTATVGVGKDFTIYALKPGFVKFWFHALKRKNYLEIVKSPPVPGSRTATTPVAPPEKYPIVRLADWELPSLLKLPINTPVDAPILERLRAWVASLNSVERVKMVPRGVPLLGGVEEIAWPPKKPRSNVAALPSAGSSEVLEAVEGAGLSAAPGAVQPLQ